MKHKLTAIDLFAGAGGLSLGFEQVGFKIIAALEIDEWAAETYKRNRNDCKIVCEDITKLSDSFFKQYSGVDAIIGGPPCQGFSISASNRRDPNDPRNFLYREFLRAVELIKPRFVFIENVKEILNAKIPPNESLLSDLCGIIAKLGYKLSYSLLNSLDFGIPQNRIRFFLAAGQDQSPSLLPTKPSGLELPLFSQSFPTPTLWEAISDLPHVTPRMHKENETLSYEEHPKNDYQKYLRNGSKKIYNHIPMRHTDRIIERFKLIPIRGKQVNIPTIHGSRKRGSPQQLSGIVYDQNHRRLNPDSPSPTITASFYSSFIHPYQHRNLTVREAARIQSFPDNYIFYGKRTTLSKKLLEKKGIYEDIHLDQFNQVGNAVPPLLAKSLASNILRIIERQGV